MLLLAVTGCAEAPAQTPTANPVPVTQSAEPVASTPPAMTFTFDGAGPYRLGLKLSDLVEAGVLDNVRSGPETCHYTSANGTGPYKELALTFRSDGTLYLISNRSTAIPTVTGARLGSTLADLQSMYGSTGEKLIRDDATAFLVTTTSGHGIMFGLDPAKKVIRMAAGSEASRMKEDFLNSVDAC